MLINNISIPKNVIKISKENNSSTYRENRKRISISQNRSNILKSQSSYNEITKKDSSQINSLPKLNQKSVYNSILTTPNNKNKPKKILDEAYKSSSPLKLRLKLDNNDKNKNKIKFRIPNRTENNFFNFKKSLKKTSLSKPQINEEKNNNNEGTNYNILDSIKDLKLFNKRELIKNTEDYDYSIIIKKLDNWDKDHCTKSKDDLYSLYKTLSNYYKKNNLVEELNNLNILDNMLKEKVNYYKYRENKIYGILGNKSKIKNNENKNPDNNEQSKVSELNSLIISKLNKDYGKNKIYYQNEMMKEKLNYENRLHRELVFINNIILNKKLIKNEKNKEIKNIFTEKNRMETEVEKIKANYMKDYWILLEKYSNEQNNIASEKLIEIKQIEENKNADEVVRKSVKRKTKKMLSNEMKELDFIHKNRISTINTEMKMEVNKIKEQNKIKFEELDKKKEKLEIELKILNDELNYYKTINEELLREHQLYYLDILKKGTDCRTDGLVWAVKNLMELQVNLEYHHFPKYLTHEQIDYLKKLAKLILDENELKIILKVLKKKQRNYKEKESVEYMNLFDNIASKKINKNEKYNNYINKKDKYSYNERILLIKKEIDKKFMKIYKDNEKALKLYLGKSLEDEKLQNFIYYVKKELYNNSNQIFLKENKVSIIDAFMGKTKNKDLFELIISITKKLYDIEQKKKFLIKKEKENYVESIKNNINGNNSQTLNFIYNKEIIKNCLFGDKIE